MQRAVHAAGAPAPRPLWFFPGLGREARPAFLMERLAGETIGRRIVRDAALAEARARLPAQMARRWPRSTPSIRPRMVSPSCPRRRRASRRRRRRSTSWRPTCGRSTSRTRRWSSGCAGCGRTRRRRTHRARPRRLPGRQPGRRAGGAAGRARLGDHPHRRPARRPRLGLRARLALRAGPSAGRRRRRPRGILRRLRAGGRPRRRSVGGLLLGGARQLPVGARRARPGPPAPQRRGAERRAGLARSDQRRDGAGAARSDRPPRARRGATSTARPGAGHAG